MKNLLTKIVFISLLFSTVVPSGIQGGVEENFSNWTTLKNKTVEFLNKTASCLNTKYEELFNLWKKQPVAMKRTALVTTAILATITAWTCLKFFKQKRSRNEPLNEVSYRDFYSMTNSGTVIRVEQGNITQKKHVGAIVNPANFLLAHGAGVAGALRKADPEWNKHCTEKIENFKEDGFKDGGIRAVITPAFELKKNDIQYIVNAVGPEGNDPQWEAKLKKTYLDALTVANDHGVESIVFPPISTGIFAKNAKGKVVIIPSKAAKIAISATREFIQKNPHKFKTIEFTSIEGDGLAHFLAYRKALGFKLSEQEQRTAQKAEKEYIASLEKR